MSSALYTKSETNLSHFSWHIPYIAIAFDRLPDLNSTAFDWFAGRTGYWYRIVCYGHECNELHASALNGLTSGGYDVQIFPEKLSAQPQAN